MASTSTKIGHGLARVLGVKLDYRNEVGSEKVTRGESVFSVSSADTYVEEEPTVAEWIADILPSRQETLRYIFSLFPFVHWITRYNMQWFVGDLVAGTSSKPYPVSCPKCAYRCHSWLCSSAAKYGLC